jgi:hypothetical protein
MSTFVIGSLIVGVLRHGAHATRSRHESLSESLGGIVAVLRTPSVGRLFVINLVVYSTFGLITGLWGGPYLAHIYGSVSRSVAVSCSARCLLRSLDRCCGLPWTAWSGSYRLPVLVGAGMTAASLGYLALVGTLAPLLLAGWFAVFGFVSAFGPLAIAHGKALFAPHQVGRGLTVLNMGTMGDTFLTQAISGIVIELFPTAADGSHDPTAYRAVFA